MSEGEGVLRGPKPVNPYARPIQDIASNVSCDLGILSIFDSNAITREANGSVTEETLLQRAQLNISRFFNKMLSMKTKQNAERDAKDEEY